MSLLNTQCKLSQCRVEKVCEPLDLITGWPSFGSNILNQTFSVVADQACTTVRRNFGPFLFTKLLKFSWDVWCELLSWCHTTASQSGWGQDSDWATPECVFSSVEAILLLIYFRVFCHRPVASPNFCWASIGGQIALHSPAKCLDKLGNIFFLRW